MISGIFHDYYCGIFGIIVKDTTHPKPFDLVQTLVKFMKITFIYLFREAFIWFLASSDMWSLHSFLLSGLYEVFALRSGIQILKSRKWDMCCHSLLYDNCGMSGIDDFKIL